ncbi:bifunctional phosphopantothenoylcysteine decarboxylase/phosphopantothenate--cysteine ligase CoaBC [soil metagenome]
MSEIDRQRPFAGRLILLGVTGSIAAYKAAELARTLLAQGAEVQPLMTHSAQAFLGPLTLQTLTRRRPMVDALELLPDQRIAHIVAADSADAILVAPATARWLAAIANGLADDVITATCLASAAPVVIAPAMDGEMYAHPATRANVERLRSFGYSIVEPEVGALASGTVGRGRLAEPGRILAALGREIAGRPVRQPDAAQRPPLLTPPREQDLHGWHIVVSAGGTAEPIDPVRYIGNRLSGRMGVAVAAAALARGARVTLVHAMTSVPLPEAAQLVHAPSAAEMRTAVLDALDGADALVMAAAVADFRLREQSDRKLARQAGLTLELDPTEDILA